MIASGGWGSIGEAGDIAILIAAGLLLFVLSVLAGAFVARERPTRAQRRRAVRQAYHWRHWWWP